MARQAHPRWGPNRLVAWLQERELQTKWPAASTVGNILDRHGLTQRRRVRRTPAWSEPFAHCQDSNQVRYVDFKGRFKTGDRQVVYPLTLEDAHPRYPPCCQGLRGTRGTRVSRSLEGVFRDCQSPGALGQ